MKTEHNASIKGADYKMQLGRLQAETPYYDAEHERIIKEIEFLKHKAEDATRLEAEVASIEAENARREAELERITKKIKLLNQFLPTIVIVFKVSELHV